MFDIRPLYIYKMIIAMFASACGPGFFERQPNLRKFVLDRDARQFPEDISIYGHYTSYESKFLRQSGVSGLLSLDHDRHSVFSEITTYPMSYVLNFRESRVPDSRLLCLDEFLRFAPNERAMLDVPLKSLPINSMFPGDYRTEAEVWGRSDDGQGPGVSSEA